MTNDFDQRVKTEVRRLVDSAPPPRALHDLVRSQRVQSVRGRHNVLLAAGIGTLIVIVALVANLISSGTSGSPRGVSGRAVDPKIVPRVELPGWRFVDQSVEYGAPGEDRGSPGRHGYLAILRSPGDPFGGPQIWVGTYEGELRYPMNGITSGLPSGRSIGRALPLDVNGANALISTVVVPSTGEQRTGIIWNPDPSYTVFVWAKRAAEQDAIDVARGLVIAPDARSATLQSIPTGLAESPLDAFVDSSPNVVRYRFERGKREITVRVVSGGRQRFEMDLFGMTDLDPVTLGRGIGYVSVVPPVPQGRATLLAWIDKAWVVHVNDSSSSAQPIDFAQLVDRMRIR